MGDSVWLAPDRSRELMDSHWRRPCSSVTPMTMPSSDSPVARVLTCGNMVGVSGKPSVDVAMDDPVKRRWPSPSVRRFPRMVAAAWLWALILPASAKRMMPSLSEGIILFDEAGKMSAHNQAAATILGNRLTEGDGHRLFTGSSIATSTEGFPLTPTMFPHVKTLATGESEDGIVIGVTDEHGRRQWLSMSSRLLSGASQTESPMVVCSFTDVTDRRAAEAQLHWLAYHDSLTGLGNRSFFNDELERELLMSMQSDTNLAVLFIDLDRFKLVNDSFGHASGDELLLELARRFKTAARKGDVVSRFSGDEFVVLSPNVRNEAHAVELAQEYSRVIDAPCLL